MLQTKELLNYVLENGERRKTRSGIVYSTFNQNMEFDLRKGFPAPTIKKLMWKAVVGELLWFLSGKTDLASLRHYSNKEPSAWTIWSNDYERWYHEGRGVPEGDLGKLYGYQWRNYGGKVDQIKQLIHGLKYQTYSRYHLVTAWSPVDRAREEMALPACHRDFQCHVTNNGELNLHFTMR